MTEDSVQNEVPSPESGFLMVYESMSLKNTGVAPVMAACIPSCPLLFGGAQALISPIQIPNFWAPNHPRRGCRGRKPHLPFGFVPRPNKARKVFLFWEKQFILDSCFLPHLGRWDNLNAVLSALTLEFLAAKLKKKKKNSKKRKPSISIPKRTRLFLETFISLVAVLVSYSVTGWWENQL